MDFSTIAQLLRTEAAKHTAIVQAADALAQIGSIDNAVREVTAAHTAIVAKKDAAQAQLDGILSDIERSGKTAAAHVERAVNVAAEHIDGAKEQATGILVQARAEAEKLWAEFHVDAEKAKDFIRAEIDKLTQDQAAADANAKFAAERLAGLQAQVDAAQAKLNAIRAAASQLAA